MDEKNEKFIRRFKIQMPEDKEELAWKLLGKNQGRTMLRQLHTYLGHAPVFADITPVFLEEYELLCSQRYTKDSARTYYGVLKTILKENNIKFESEEVVQIDASSDTEITNEDISKLKSLVPYETDKCAVYRAFMVSLFCGCSFHDSEKITIESVRLKDGRVFYTSEDGIDVMSFLTDDLLKYISFPVYIKNLTEQKANDVLKLVMLDAGITKQITIDDARTTFATRLYKAQVCDEEIAELLGITESKVGKYIHNYLPQKYRRDTRRIVEQMYN